MSTKTVEILESLQSKAVILQGVRTLTGLTLEQAIVENAERRQEASSKNKQFLRDSLASRLEAAEDIKQ